jgi:hypothetical protein
MKVKLWILLITIVLTAMPSTGASATYTYDVAGRLIRVDYGGKGFTYTYDNNGNLLARAAFEQARRRRAVRRSALDPSVGRPPATKLATARTPAATP